MTTAEKDHKDAEKQLSGKKSCFVICPIGADGSPERRWSDQMLKYVITPVIKACDYETPIRASEIAHPGVITSQIIERITNADLVVADLTGSNANVFYELAVRHATRKPVVKLMRKGEHLPFDVIQSRTIFVDLSDLDSVHSAKEEMEKQVRSINARPVDSDNPISNAIDLLAGKNSGDPELVQSAHLLEIMQTLQNSVYWLSEELAAMKSRPLFPYAANPTNYPGASPSYSTYSKSSYPAPSSPATDIWKSSDAVLMKPPAPSLQQAPKAGLAGYRLRKENEEEKK